MELKLGSVQDISQDLSHCMKLCTFASSKHKMIFKVYNSGMKDIRWYAKNAGPLDIVIILGK